MTRLATCGSNLFRQSHPSPLAPKILPAPSLVVSSPRRCTYEVLLATDSQTLVQCTPTDADRPGSYLEIWGYDETADTVGVRSELAGPESALGLPRPADVQQWLATDRIVGYLARDGILHALRSPGLADAHDGLCSTSRTRYAAVTISGTGQVLAAPTLGCARETGTEAQRSPIGHLELWPSLDSLLNLGSGPGETELAKPIALPNVDPLETEVQLASGAAHFLILTHTSSSAHSGHSDGPLYHSTLYTFGDNRFGQLGQGFRSHMLDQPRAVDDLPSLKTVACGLFHSLALGTEGELYTFGHNRHGQCGLRNEEADLSRPTLVDLGGRAEQGDIVDVLDACCGSEHTVALTDRGIWVAGSSRSFWKAQRISGLNRDIIERLRS